MAAVLIEEAFTLPKWPQGVVVRGGLDPASAVLSVLCLVGVRQCDSLGLARWKLGSGVLLRYGAAFGLATLTFAGPQTGATAEIALPSVLCALGYFSGPGRSVREAASSAVALVFRSRRTA